MIIKISNIRRVRIKIQIYADAERNEMPGDSMLRDGRFCVSERDISTLRSLDVHGAAHVCAECINALKRSPRPSPLVRNLFLFPIFRDTRFWNFSKKEPRTGIEAGSVREVAARFPLHFSAYHYLSNIDFALS
jgi:hypothetical protein